MKNPPEVVREPTDVDGCKTWLINAINSLTKAVANLTESDLSRRDGLRASIRWARQHIDRAEECLATKDESE